MTYLDKYNLLQAIHKITEQKLEHRCACGELQAIRVWPHDGQAYWTAGVTTLSKMLSEFAVIVHQDLSFMSPMFAVHNNAQVLELH